MVVWGIWIKDMYNKERKKLVAGLGEFNELLAKHNAWLAGGAVTSAFTSKPVNDFDIYFRNPEALEAFLGEIEGMRERIVYMSDKAFCVLNGDTHVQIIFFDFFETAEDIFAAFDYTNVMGAYDIASGKFHLHDDFLLANSQRRLTFNPGTRFPLISMLRAFKYQERGFNISKAEILKVLLSCMSLQLNSWTDARVQIGGLYGVNPDKILPDNGEPFTLDRMAEYLQNPDLDDEIFKVPAIGHLELPEFNVIVAIATGRVHKAFRDKGKMFYYDGKGRLKQGNLPEGSYELIEAPEPMTLYKIARRGEDKIVSCWIVGNEQFVYHTDKPTTDPTDHGLYFYGDKERALRAFKHHEDRVLLTCKADWGDVIRYNGEDLANLDKESYQIRVKTCTVVKVESA